MWTHCAKSSLRSYDWKVDKKRFFEGSGRVLNSDAAEELVATSQVVVDIYRSKFHEITSPDSPIITLTPDGIVVSTVLSSAAKTTKGYRPLRIAAKDGSLDYVRFLLSCGCVVNTTGDY